MKRKENSFMGIREIAQIANVSTATVSRVINHPEKCSESTRNKVMAVIEEYNYIPNETIKNIFSKSSNTIAIFIHDINNVFYTRLIMELNNICFKGHYTLLICDTENDFEKEKAYLEFCLAKRCEGIIVTEGTTNTLFDNLNTPVVYLDRRESSNINYVTSENYHSVRKAVSYLYNLGHRKIAFVGTKEGMISVETRFQGYLDELKERGLPVCQDFIFLENEALDGNLGKTALQHFLSLPQMPTAILCACDMIALGVINEAKVLDIKIPDSLSVCGFDHVLDNVSYIPLTTVEQNIPKIALELFSSLTSSSDKPIHRIVDSTFVPGQTCAKLSLQDE